MRWMKNPPNSTDVHVLTFAEEGFSAFSHHAQLAGLDKAAQTALADAINERNEVGCLLPRARISAMPRIAVRMTRDPRAVLLHLRDMRAAVLAGRVPQRTIVIDLSSPGVPPHARAALDQFAKEVSGDADAGIQWIAFDSELEE